MTVKYKIFPALVTTVIIALTSCFERNDMYDFAKNGVKVIYALNSNTTNAYIATEDDLIKNFSVTTSISGTPAGAFPLNGKLIAMEYASNLYFHSYDRSSWSYVSQTFGGTPGGIFLMDNKIYYTNSATVYYFDGESYQTLTITNPSSKLSMTGYNSEIYILGGDNRVYRYVNSPTAEDTGTVAATAGGNFVSIKIIDGIIYIGYDDLFCFTQMGGASYTVVNPTGIQSYAMYNPSAIFAAGYSSQIDIMKLKGGSFNTIKQITADSTPALVIEALSETKLAIGISGGTSADGLYVLDTETGKMKTLTTDSIVTINISDHLY